jgi:hypothetical protein
MSQNVTYETMDPTVGDGRDYATGNLGKSDNKDNLSRAFAGSPIYAPPGTAMENAKAIYGAYNGENTSYGLGMYSSNFHPDKTAGEIYDDPRNKLTTPVGPEGLPATPFSPNVASPGEGNGNNAKAISQTVEGLIPVSARPPVALNPTNLVNEGTNSTSPVGAVRTFKLGIGSSYPRDTSNP